MSVWMRVATGVVAVEIWAAIPDPPGSSNPAVFVSTFCFPLLFAAALVVGYRTYTWKPSSEAAPAPLPRRWLWERIAVSIATLPASLLVMATYLGLVNVNPLRGGVLEAAVGVSLFALVLVATRWGSSHWWSSRACRTSSHRIGPRTNRPR
jgi:hypothetical protein